MDKEQIDAIVNSYGIADEDVKSVLADILSRKEKGNPIVVSDASSMYKSLFTYSTVHFDEMLELLKSLSLMGIVFTDGFEEAHWDSGSKLVHFVTVDPAEIEPKVATPLNDDVFLLFSNAKTVEVHQKRDVVSILVKSQTKGA